MNNLLKINERAPEFSLPNQYGEIINLSDFFGKRILIYFYPKAMTAGCTLQSCKLRDAIDLFKKMQVEILGISVDKIEKLFNFSKKESLNFRLLSDPDHKVAGKFGVWGIKKFMGKVFYGMHRITFLINSKGYIEQVFNKFKISDHHEIVLDYLNFHS